MKVRNKGKIHPSPSSSSVPCLQNNDVASLLKLLPVAIMALVSLLSLQDREVLAYLITRSLKSTNTCSLIEDNNKQQQQQQLKNRKSSNHIHKPPLFDCDCFDCYTSYWFKWDTSPNRELIHQAIEAFEEHLTTGEQSNNSRGKKRDKMSRRPVQEPVILPDIASPEIDYIFVHLSPENSMSPLMEKDEVTLENGEDKVADAAEAGSPEEEVESPEIEVVARGTAPSNHKGLARKVLPDVWGLLNSRFWGLWSPNA